MAEQVTIKADQIEGLREVIRAEVREALREEVRSAPEDMDQLRRSPAGTVIRLEGKVEALDEKIDGLRSEMNQRFEALEDKMNQRFEALERRFNLFQWVLVLNFSLLIAMAGKLFLMK